VEYAYVIMNLQRDAAKVPIFYHIHIHGPSPHPGGEPGKEFCNSDFSTLATILFLFI
jgi:hypothetical protein